MADGGRVDEGRGLVHREQVDHKVAELDDRRFGVFVDDLEPEDAGPIKAVRFDPHEHPHGAGERASFGEVAVGQWRPRRLSETFCKWLRMAWPALSGSRSRSASTMAVCSRW
jgi:hypothetical protein